MSAPPQPPPFDVHAYTSRYPVDSETRLQRLLHVAHRFDDGAAGGGRSDVTRDALSLAVAQMRAAGNYRRYAEEYGAVAECGTPAGGGGDDAGAPMMSPVRPAQTTRHIIQHYLPYDSEFVRTARLDAAAKAEVLEARLASAQSQLLKDSIRSAMLALAEFHWERGELKDAWRRVARSREFCSGGRQHTQVCLMLIELSVDLREWGSVRDAISRAEHTVMSSDGEHGGGLDPLFHAKLRAAGGLAHLAEGRYAEAARSFTSVSTELTGQFASVVSAEDIALYGGLLGLATMDRAGLHAHVIDGPFKGRLELVPNMREALRHYSKAEYGACLSLLQTAVLPDLLIDIHLHAHAPILLGMISDRCMVQYFRPYSSVSLAKMGAVFGCDADEMMSAVSRLVASGGVDGSGLGEGARIDSLRKTLSVESPGAVERRARRRARVRAAKMGVEFARNAEGIVLRASCVEAGVVIQGERRGGGGWRGRGGRGREGGGDRPDAGFEDLNGSDDDSSGDLDREVAMAVAYGDYEEMDVDLVNPNEEY